VSLDSLLTTTRLRTLAGSGYQRGLKYFEQGQVVECAREGETLIGLVDGTETYDVRVFAHGRQVYGQCSCPVGGPMCKHAVALALHYLAEQEGSPRSAPAPEVALADPVFATTRELSDDNADKLAALIRGAVGLFLKEHPEAARAE